MNTPLSVLTVVQFPGQNITTSGTTASVTLANDSSGNKPKYVRIAATVAAYVRLTKGASTAVAADMVIQPGDAQIVSMAGGLDTISAIQVTAAGIVNIVAVENY